MNELLVVFGHSPSFHVHDEWESESGVHSNCAVSIRSASVPGPTSIYSTSDALSLLSVGSEYSISSGCRADLLDAAEQTLELSWEHEISALAAGRDGSATLRPADVRLVCPRFTNEEAVPRRIYSPSWRSTAGACREQCS